MSEDLPARIKRLWRECNGDPQMVVKQLEVNGAVAVAGICPGVRVGNTTYFPGNGSQQ